MDLLKLVEKTVYSYLINEKVALSSFESKKMVEGGYLYEDTLTPTTKSIEHYLNKFNVAKYELPLITQIQLDNDLKGALDTNILFSKILRLLSKIKGCAGFVVTFDGSFFVGGLSNLLDKEAFRDLDAMREALYLLDNPVNLLNLLESDFSLNLLKVKFGENFMTPNLSEAVLISRYFFVGGEFMKSGYIGVLTSKNANYEFILPYLEYIGKSFEEKLPSKPDPIEVFEEPKEEAKLEDGLIQNPLPLKQKKSILAALSSKFKSK